MALFNTAGQPCLIPHGKYWSQEKRGEIEFDGVYSYLKLSSSGEVLEQTDLTQAQTTGGWNMDSYKVSGPCADDCVPN